MNGSLKIGFIVHNQFHPVLDAIVTALFEAKFPHIIVGNSGQNPSSVPLLTELSSILAISIFASCPSAVAVSYAHPYLIGSSFIGKHEHLREMDVILVLDADIPWMDTMGTKPADDARVFMVDCDPLKQTFGWAHTDADMLCRADSQVALAQILDEVQRRDGSLPESQKLLASAAVQERAKRIEGWRAEWVARLDGAARTLAPDGTTPTPAFALRALRTAVSLQTPSRGSKVLWINEGVSNCGNVWDHIGPEEPGSMFMSGGASLGWSLGACVGGYLGGKVGGKGYELVVAVVGDGDFIFSVPTAAYWMARRYNTVRMHIY